VKKFVRAVKALRVGDCTEAGVDIGPLIHKDGLEKVERLVADATGKGAKVLVGGASHDKGGLYYQPTVLDGCSEDMDLYAEEIFGPVAALYQFEDEGEVIRRANDTNVGLAAYFYTRDLARSVRVSEALAYGMVAVNSGILSSPVAPFGGVKESGFGREGSKYGLDDYMNVKYVMTAL
jgi:succinate-semialdehyde dehydrogenase/glutarate-semialdehyde dehydrogenase